MSVKNLTWQEKIARASSLAMASGLMKPGEVVHMVVYHDHDCPADAEHGGSQCICNADIRILTHAEWLKEEGGGS